MKAFLAALALSFVPIAACGAPPENADPALAPWFRTLQNPTTGQVCCGSYDGHIMSRGDVRTDGDVYQIRVEDHWWPVPPDVVLNQIANPTGRYVAFYSQTVTMEDKATALRIYCFIRPAET
jgi:hypothetical protein